LSLRIYYETGETAQLPKIRFGRKSFLVLNRPNQSVIEFVKNLQLITNGIGAENDKPSENPELTNGADRENVTHQAVDKILQQMAGLPESDKPVAKPSAKPASIPTFTHEFPLS
jgi:hypothetical protein